jgi:archaellum component FlaF (FlaF/FlaG flagellin family)
MFKSKKGVSEVVASLIVLLIISVLGTSIYSASVTMMQKQRDTMKWTTNIESEKYMEKIRILNVNWNSTIDGLKIFFLNHGNIVINVADIYLNGFRVLTYIEGRNVPIQISDIHIIKIESPITIAIGEFYEITVVTGRGVSHVYNWKP